MIRQANTVVRRMADGGMTVPPNDRRTGLAALLQQRATGLPEIDEPPDSGVMPMQHGGIVDDEDLYGELGTVGGVGATPPFISAGDQMGQAERAYLEHIKRLQERKTAPWRQILGSVLSISPRLRGVGSEVSGEAGRQRSLGQAGVLKAAADEERLAGQTRAMGQHRASSLELQRQAKEEQARHNQALEQGAESKPFEVDPTKELVVRDPKAEGGVRTVRQSKTKEPTISNFEALATQVLQKKLPPDQEKTELERIRNTANSMNPEKPITHFETDTSTGRVTAVTVKPSEITAAGGRKDLGTIGTRNKPPDMDNREWDRIKGLVDDVRVDKNIQTFNAVRDAYQRVASGAKRGDGVGDLTLLRSFAKLTDPTTGVREEEYRTMQAAMGSLQKMGIQITQGMWNGQQLTPQGRQHFLQQARELYDGHKSSYDQARNYYRDLAIKARVDPNLVVPNITAESGGQKPATQGAGGVEKWVRDKSGKLVRQ